MSEALDHLANRVAADPFFLAFPLAEYARSERLDDSALAAALGCRVEDLTLLRLCRMPRDDPAGFRADTAAIAERFGIAPAKLADAVRRGQGLARLRAAAPATAETGFLLAARDDEPKPPTEETPP
ncbi:MAG TPA: hypothetical protein VKE74_30035 [Gemmataceae bacterium]|nr:hypothetical protein [Gemmataceae bacterium]